MAYWAVLLQWEMSCAGINVIQSYCLESRLNFWEKRKVHEGTVYNSLQYLKSNLITLQKKKSAWFQLSLQQKTASFGCHQRQLPLKDRLAVVVKSSPPSQSFPCCSRPEANIVVEIRWRRAGSGQYECVCRRSDAIRWPPSSQWVVDLPLVTWHAWSRWSHDCFAWDKEFDSARQFRQR